MESPGSLIRRAREAAGVELAELAQTTRIPRASLQHIENDSFEMFPAEVFVRGFLRNIARELKLDQDQMIATYEAHTGRKHSSPVELLETQDDPTTLKIATSSLRSAPARPRSTRRRVRMPSFDSVVEVVGSTRPSYVIGTLLVLLGIALAISVITNGMDYDQRLTFSDAPTSRATWDVQLDGKSTLRSRSSVVGATTLDLIRDDASAEKTAQ